MSKFRFSYEVEADNIDTAYEIAQDNLSCFNVEEILNAEEIHNVMFRFHFCIRPSNEVEANNIETAHKIARDNLSCFKVEKIHNVEEK